MKGSVCIPVVKTGLAINVLVPPSPQVTIELENVARETTKTRVSFSFLVKIICRHNSQIRDKINNFRT